MPAKKGGTLGILPASFNPPTSAHEALVRQAARAIAFDEILLIVDQQAMDKALFGAPLEDRLLMLIALFGDDPRVSVGICNRGLFIDKLAALQKVYPRETQTYFIVGYDTMVRVLAPTYYEDKEEALRSLFARARFLVANREGCDERDLKELFGLEENRCYAAQVLPITLPPELTRVSSSHVRRLLAEGKSVEGLIPPTLKEFLRTKGFYGRQGG
jgi:nicotinic acid mononucleotide adenylyltransferase